MLLLCFNNEDAEPLLASSLIGIYGRSRDDDLRTLALKSVVEERCCGTCGRSCSELDALNLILIVEHIIPEGSNCR